MSVAARRPRLCEQSAAGAFPLVIGSLRFDLTVVRKPPACRADERPLMWAPVGASDGRAGLARRDFREAPATDHGA
jgi:hypothetical protein